MIDVLIVDDSLTVRKWLSKLLTAKDNFRVIGEAHNGEQAVEMTVKLCPNLIVMDHSMPRRDGLSATRWIMANQPVPIVILSGAERDQLTVIDIIKAGAIEFIEKPKENTNRADWEKHFCSILQAVAKIDLSRQIHHAQKKQLPSKEKGFEIIAIGASTGGPRQIAKLLSQLSPLPIPVVILLHIPKNTAENFVSWYSAVASTPVIQADVGQTLESVAGKICIVGSEEHLIVKNKRFRFSNEAERNFCKPSIDVLFESLAKDLPGQALGILMTGIGSDGAAGLLQIKNSGGYTIAQDEASSVVYGMPKAAKELGAAEEILSLEEIPLRINEIILNHMGEAIYV